MLWLQLGDQLGLEPAGLLGIQVAHFLRDIKEGGDNLVMALFSTFLCDAACTANFNRELLAAGVSDKLAWLLLHILSRTGGFINSPALLRALKYTFRIFFLKPFYPLYLSITDFLDGSVALLHGLVVGLLLECDAALLLKVLLANLV